MHPEHLFKIFCATSCINTNFDEYFEISILSIEGNYIQANNLSFKIENTSSSGLKDREEKKTHNGQVVQTISCILAQCSQLWANAKP